jgi:eukaryotic-like serine/threonine-protein kinase
MHPGVRLADRYRLDDRVGTGGMGEVWRATDEVLGRTVAVKVVLPALLGEPDFVHRFLAEARAMASVNHPHVAAIHDYRSDGGVAFLVMEYVEGEPLSHILRRLGPLRPAEVMRIVAQAAEALQAVHDRGIVHRDVKPANLLIRPDGTVVLTDFGIARAEAATAITTPGALLGTPSYLAPEQVLGQPATALSDVYALGLVAYECLSGRRPFEGDNPFAVAMQRVQEPPRALGDAVPPAIAAVIRTALATDPVQRWPSAAHMATAARRALTNPVPPRAPQASPPPAGASRSRRDQGRAQASGRRRLAVIGGVIIGVVLVAAGTLVVTGTVLRSADAGTNPRGAHPSVTPSDAVPATGPAVTTGPATTTGLAGFVACGDVFCPPQPMCWSGLVAIGGVARDPTPADCAQPHYWETFVVASLPPGARGLRQETLMDRSDVAAICSENAMAQRSTDASHTHGWVRDAWPVQITGDTWIMHCMANSGEGEKAGSVFRSGR